MPDYGKQKSGKSAGGAPRHSEHNAPGGRRNPFGARADKAELLNRLTEKARARGAQSTDEAPEKG